MGKTIQVFDQAAKDRLVYGRKSILELLVHSSEIIEQVFVVPGAQLPRELSEQLSLAEKNNILVQEIERSVFEQSGIGKGHQGIAAILKPHQQESVEQVIARGLCPEAQGLVLLLDQIEDPQNLGAILRVAEAAGVDGVLITRERSAGISPAVRKVSAGASELLSIGTVVNLSRTIALLKKSGYWVLGTALGTESQSLYEVELPRPLALVMGSEGRGLRKLTKEHCDVLVEIPILGRVQSLNVSQATSVLLYEIVRRQRFCPSGERG